MRLTTALIVALLTSVDPGPSNRMVVVGSGEGGQFLANVFLPTAQQSSVSDPCIDEDDRPRRCMPSFINAAFGRPVEATSTCGDPPSRLPCELTEQHQQQQQLGGGSLGRPAGGGGRRRTTTTGCPVEFCDSRGGGGGGDQRYQHPPRFLTDLNNPLNRSCWISEPLSALEDRNVTLTLNLGKKYEITYVSLQFCLLSPDQSATILKSSDFGKTWAPFQYYSGNCRRVFGKAARAVAHRSNEQVAFCSEFGVAESAPSGRAATTGTRVAFSTLEGRPSAYDFDNSPVLQDWVTATDVRIVFQASPVATKPPRGKTKEATAAAGSDHLEQLYFSLSDLAVGGRCKCNGHAHRCIVDVHGRQVCDCKHHTAGTDCERCDAFYYDRPWARATANDANECIACVCNQHTRQCRFDMELYKLSGHRSGARCVNCRHNTDGRNCQMCKDGFYRDTTRPITHRKACKACDCHHVGSLGRMCNRTTGQCKCKDGVTGPTCNRCANGYQQSRTPVTPCVKSNAKTNGNNSMIGPMTTPPGSCTACVNNEALNKKTFCAAEYAIQTRILSRESFGEWFRFTAFVINSYKHPAGKLRRKNDFIWAPVTDATCNCPKVDLNRTYLIVGHTGRQSSAVQGNLVIDRMTIAMPWNTELTQQLKKFVRGQQRGEC